MEKGCANLVHHHQRHPEVRHQPGGLHQPLLHRHRRPKYDLVKKAAEAAGARCAVSKHWQKGGDGALELADAVIDACNEKIELQVPLPAGDAAAPARRD